MLGVRHDFDEQPSDVLVVEGIDDLTARSLPHHQSKVPQHPKLLGDGRLLHLDVMG